MYDDTRKNAMLTILIRLNVIKKYGHRFHRNERRLTVANRFI